MVVALLLGVWFQLYFQALLKFGDYDTAAIIVTSRRTSDISIAFELKSTSLSVFTYQPSPITVQDF